MDKMDIDQNIDMMELEEQVNDTLAKAQAMVEEAEEFLKRLQLSEEVATLTARTDELMKEAIQIEQLENIITGHGLGPGSFLQGPMAY